MIAAPTFFFKGSCHTKIYSFKAEGFCTPSLDRFSEGLDFSLLQPDPDFSLDKYLDAIQNEFETLGMQVSIKEKKKAKDTQN